MSRKSSWFVIALFVVIMIPSFAVRCTSPDRGQQKAVKIGAILPLTGPGSVFAQYIKAGLDLALEEINEEEDFEFQIIYGDSKNQPKEALGVYNKLVTIEKVPVVIVALSSVAKALAPLATSTGTVQLDIAVAVPGVADVSEYVFRIYPEAHGMAGVMSRFAIDELKAKTAGVIYINDDFGRSSYEIYKEIFESLGGKVVFSESYELTQADFRSQISKLKATSPDCIYLSGYGIAYGAIVRQLNELGVQYQLTADMTMGLPNTLEQAGKASEGAYFVDGNMSEWFSAKFSQRYNKNPTSYAGYAYDILGLLRKVLKESSNEFTADSVRDALLRTSNFPGAMGNITILPNGESNLRFVVKRIENGVPVLVQSAS